MVNDIIACFYCNDFFKKNEITKDHIIAKSKKGSNHKMNLIVSCKGCNNLKGNYSLIDFKIVLEKKLSLFTKNDYEFNRIKKIIENVNYLIINYLPKNIQLMKKQ